MQRPKRWYNPNGAASVRVITRSAEDESFFALKWRHPRVAPTLGECLIYPLKDGPGLGFTHFLSSRSLDLVAADLRRDRGARALDQKRLGSA